MKTNRFFLLLVLAVPVLAMAQWQWIDKDGHKVFSDRGPPPDIPAKNIIKQPTTTARPWEAFPAVGASAPKAGASVASAPSNPENARKIADEEEARKKRIAQNCDRARASLTVLRSGIRLKTANAQGEIEAVNDTERNGEIDRLQTFVNTDCK